MKSIFALLAIVLFGVGLAACGSASDTHSASAASAGTSGRASKALPNNSPQGYLNDGDNDVIGDADNDNNHDDDNDNSEDHKPEENGDYHDGDDRGIVSFGQPADPADKRAVTATVKRYYALAAAGDGATACTMLTPSLARSAEQDYGHGSAGPTYLSAGRNCVEVLGLLFGHFHTQLTSTTTVITGVRVEGKEAIALLGSRAQPAGEIPLTRIAGVWRIGSLFGGALP